MEAVSCRLATPKSHCDPASRLHDAERGGTQRQAGSPQAQRSEAYVLRSEWNVIDPIGAMPAFSSVSFAAATPGASTSLRRFDGLCFLPVPVEMT